MTSENSGGLFMPGSLVCQIERAISAGEGPHGLETDKWHRHTVKTDYEIKPSIHLLFCKSLHYEDIAGVQSVK